MKQRKKSSFGLITTSNPEKLPVLTGQSRVHDNGLGDQSYQTRSMVWYYESCMQLGSFCIRDQTAAACINIYMRVTKMHISTKYRYLHWDLHSVIHHRYSHACMHADACVHFQRSLRKATTLPEKHKSSKVACMHAWLPLAGHICLVQSHEKAS